MVLKVMPDWCTAFRPLIKRLLLWHSLVWESKLLVKVSSLGAFTSRTLSVGHFLLLYFSFLSSLGCFGSWSRNLFHSAFLLSLLVCRYILILLALGSLSCWNLSFFFRWLNLLLLPVRRLLVKLVCDSDPAHFLIKLGFCSLKIIDKKMDELFIDFRLQPAFQWSYLRSFLDELAL